MRGIKRNNEDSKFWELESGFQILDVQGRLKQSLSFWRDILDAPPPVVDCIENGYHLPLKFLPPPFSQNNHKSAIDNSIFVNEAVNELVVNRCACAVSDKPYICSPLSVVSGAMGKLRLVLNLRYVPKPISAKRNLQV